MREKPFDLWQRLHRLLLAEQGRGVVEPRAVGVRLDRQRVSQKRLRILMAAPGAWRCQPIMRKASAWLGSAVRRPCKSVCARSRSPRNSASADGCSVGSPHRRPRVLRKGVLGARHIALIKQEVAQRMPGFGEAGVKACRLAQRP